MPCVVCDTAGCAWCRATAADPRDRFVLALAGRVFACHEILARLAERRPPAKPPQPPEDWTCLSL